ncbi:MAG: hypothetical protein KatS3mg096_802 [Candidatus Parcubacteria bacterium]|nr:MAG: hypothetical protein KatS3mg096_802 [Candidatus Parcubacteria bacterium]
MAKSKKATGDYYERKVKKELEKQGFIVYKPVRTKWSEKDIFGLFDLIAYNPPKHRLGLGELMFIQVKKNKKDFNKEILEQLKIFIKNMRILGTYYYWNDKGKMNFRGWFKILKEKYVVDTPY